MTDKQLVNIFILAMGAFVLIANLLIAYGLNN
jgi:hypothetical protein